MKKRVFSMFLCLCMVFTLVGAMVPTAAAATNGLDEFGIAISGDNPYLSGKRSLTTITEKAKNDNGTLRCTVYVWQKVLEEYGIKLPSWIEDHGGGDIRRDAYLWYEKAKNQGIEVGGTPRPNSIVVYEGKESGHVALVTAVNGNKMTVQEAGIKDAVTGDNKGGIQTVNIDIAKTGDKRWSAYKVLGYIYLDNLISPPPPPAMPKNITYVWTPTGNKWQARISWDTVSGASSYQVQYRTPKTSNNWRDDGDYSSGNSYTSTGLGDYDSYDYRVRALNAGGPSDWNSFTIYKPTAAGTTPAKPLKPQGVSATWSGATGARVSWSDVSGADSYKVQGKKATGNYWTSEFIVRSGTSCTFPWLDVNTSWYFYVEAVNDVGSSGRVECYLPAQKTIVEDLGQGNEPPKLAAPSGVSGEWTSTGSKWQARISWNAVSGATRYEVQYRTPTTGNAWRTDADYSSGTSYISTGLGDYNSYDYRVRAVNAAGASDWTEYTLEKKASTSTKSPTSGNHQISSVYIQQMDGDGCYVAAAAMVISNYRLLNGGSAITYAEAKTANGNRTYFDWGTFGKYGLKDVDLWTSANSGLSGSARAQMVVNALGKNNYGAMLCFRGNGKSHAVVVVGYENGSIIVNDPARNGLGGEKIKLTDCKYIRNNITGYVSQEQMLTYANSLTYFVANGNLGVNTGTTPPIVDPQSPSGVLGTWTSTGPKWQARISWNPVSGATGYEVQYKTPKTGNAWKADADYSSGTSYISTGLGDYNSYDYRIRAVNANGVSDWTEYTLVKTTSAQDPTPPTPPSAPSGVSGEWTSTGPKWQARISWNAVSGATRYEVQYRTPTTGNAWRTDSDYSSGTSYISTGLGNYNSYDYRVRAVNANGASDWTEYTLVKTASTSAPAATAPAAPTNVSGTWTSRGPNWQARISWIAVSGATRYEVQYRTPRTGNEWRTDADYSSGTSYISTGLGSYNSYDYRVRAVNANGASDWTEYTLYK